MPVRQLASSPSPDSDDGEGSVPEPPDSKASAIIDPPRPPPSDDGSSVVLRFAHGSLIVLLQAVVGSPPALSDSADRCLHRDVSLPKYGPSWRLYPSFLAHHETFQLAPIASDPRRRRRITWLLSDSANTARPPGPSAPVHQSGSGTLVRQLVSSPSPISDDGEGYVPEPPDLEESDASSKHAQDFC